MKILRIIRKNVLHAVVTLLSLALGIGAATAFYGSLDALFINPVPGPAADRVVQIGICDRSDPDQSGLDGISPDVLLLFSSRREFFSDLSWSCATTLEFRNNDFKTAVAGQWVSPNFFQMLNTRPLLGRVFSPADAVPVGKTGVPEQDSVMVINHTLWKSRFGGDPGVVGQAVVMSGCRFVIVGVMPEHFQFPRARESFWIPVEDPRPGSDWASEIAVLARLSPGAGLKQAQAMLGTVYGRVDNRPAPQEPGLGLSMSTTVLTARSLCNHFPKNPGVDKFERTLLGLLGAVVFFLLIACLNVANLTLAQIEKRQAEFAIRAALGAGRFRLVRQLMAEAAALAIPAGIASVGIGAAGMHCAASIIPSNMQRLRAVSFDAHALGFTVVATVMAVLLCGLAPAWRAGSHCLGEGLKHAGPAATVSKGRMRFRGMLVVSEIALALVLLSGAGLMAASVMRLLHVNPGFDPENLLYINLWLPGKYSDSINAQGAAGLRNQLFSQMREQIAALPGVRSSGIYGGNAGSGSLPADGRLTPVEFQGVGCSIAEGDLFRVMRQPLLAGRPFGAGDTGGDAKAVIVNEELARLCWPGQSALGKSFSSVSPSGMRRRCEVIGVVADARMARFVQKPAPLFYGPCQDASFQGEAPSVLLAVRTGCDPELLTTAIRAKLRTIEPELWNPRIQVARRVLYDSTQIQRVFLLGLALAAGAGLALAALGIYALLEHSVVSRTREIGIRMAMGADPRRVQIMILAQGVRHIVVGLGVGLLPAYWLAQWLESLLFEVRPADPLILAAVLVLPCAAGLMACWFPARRATQVDPVKALRCEC